VGGESSLQLARGQNAFISQEEGEISFTGDGEIFIAH
jgi:mannose-6-phosphate isomerase class I